jgi:hypothetical protein
MRYICSLFFLLIYSQLQGYGLELSYIEDGQWYQLAIPGGFMTPWRNIPVTRYFFETSKGNEIVGYYHEGGIYNCHGGTFTPQALSSQGKYVIFPIESVDVLLDDEYEEIDLSSCQQGDIIVRPNLYHSGVLVDPNTVIEKQGYGLLFMNNNRETHPIQDSDFKDKEYQCHRYQPNPSPNNDSILDAENEIQLQLSH